MLTALSKALRVDPPVDAVIAAAASISPISIEPESPMKIRAGEKLCGRKPRQAPGQHRGDQRRRERDVAVARPGPRW